MLPLQASRVDLSGFDLGDDGVMVGTVVAWLLIEPVQIVAIACLPPLLSLLYSLLVALPSLPPSRHRQEARGARAAPHAARARGRAPAPAGAPRAREPGPGTARTGRLRRLARGPARPAAAA